MPDISMTLAATAVLGYLIGAAPVIYLVARWRGIDLRNVGTGNIGTGNLWRHGGSRIGMMSLIVETGKGATAPLLARGLDTGDTATLSMAVAAVAAVAGQMWPVTLRFQGGRGNGTMGGALLVLNPLAFLGGFLAFTALSSRKVARLVRPGGGGGDAPRSRTVPIGVLIGVGVYAGLGFFLSAVTAVSPLPAVAALLIGALILLRRATAPWPADPETGEVPPRSLLSTLLYDRPNRET